MLPAADCGGKFQPSSTARSAGPGFGGATQTHVQTAGAADHTPAV